MKKLSFRSLACTFFATVTLASIFSAFTACNPSAESKTPKANKLSIVTTIYPEFAWTKEILGNLADSNNLSLLIKNGVDLHSYKPSAQDIAKIASADMVVYVGGESDEWIEDALKATPKKGRTEISLMKVLGSRVKPEEIVEGMQTDASTSSETSSHHHEHAETHESDEHHAEHVEKHEHSGEHVESHDEHEHRKKHEHHDEHAEAHDHHHHDGEAENDEHVWLSLKNAEILVKKIAEGLAKIDSVHASSYEQNATAYVAKIKELDSEYSTAIEKAARKTVLFGDRFPFRYLVDDYGIKYYAAFVGCSAESEASFETIAFLAGKMDSDSLPAIFTIEKGNKKIASAVLATSKSSKNAAILTLNSMQSVTEQQIAEGIDYLTIMRSNLDVLKKALN